jgi:toxin ParE1/3/4
MTCVELASGVFDDFERCLDHMTQFVAEDAPTRINEIVEALQILAHSPYIGRPVRGGKRELVIGRGTRGYIALYRYASASDIATILAIRSQGEAGSKR